MSPTSGHTVRLCWRGCQYTALWKGRIFFLIFLGCHLSPLLGFIPSISIYVTCHVNTFFFWILDGFSSLLELLLMNIRPTVSPWCYPFVSTPLFSWFSKLYACLLRGESESWSSASSRQDGFQISCACCSKKSSSIHILSNVLSHIPT